MRRTKAFRTFDVKLKNDRWSWSGISKDGKTVAITAWTDRLSHGQSPVVYDGMAHSRPIQDRLGFRELMDNLKHAQEHCDGLLRVVMSRPKDATDEPREVKDSWPRPDLLLRITELDPERGFTAEVVDVLAE